MKSLLSLGLGLAAGAAAVLLVAPMRGTELRRSLRSHADGVFDNSKRLISSYRRAFSTRDSSATTPGSTSMTATLGEIAQMHSTDELSSLGARS